MIPAAETIPAASHARPAARRPTVAGIRSAVRTLTTIAEAYAALLLFDLLALRGFQRTYTYTRGRRVSSRQPDTGTIAHVCWCVEEACVWYWKRAFCLQRSAVATWLLRRRGVAAELVIGFRPVPIDSHAWVEVAGQVVNDRPQYQIHFRVLDRM
jgi:hypothetical protein